MAADVGAKEWVNACRSGDYVGRFIWTSGSTAAFGVAGIGADVAGIDSSLPPEYVVMGLYFLVGSQRRFREQRSARAPYPGSPSDYAMFPPNLAWGPWLSHTMISGTAKFVDWLAVRT